MVSWLFPMYLAALGALALPILLHRIRRTPSGRRPFSSLMFLAPSLPRLTRRSRLEHILLLALRGLALCLIAAAFARPFFRQSNLTTMPAMQGRLTVLLLDTSASMRRTGLWPQALANVDAILGELAESDRVAVMTFSDRPTVLSGFDAFTSSAARNAVIRDRLASVLPGWGGTDFGTALVAAVNLVIEAGAPGAPTDVARKEIVLVSDMQQGGRLDALQNADWPKDVELRLVPVVAQEPTNAGMHWIASSAATDPADGWRPRVRVANAADSRREQFRLSWAGAGGADPVDLYVPPGEVRTVVTPPLPVDSSAGAAAPPVPADRPSPRRAELIAEHQLILTGDDHDFDNTLYVCPPKPRRATVLFVGDAKADDPNGALYYLVRAFPPTPWQSVEVTTCPAAGPLPGDGTHQLFVVAEKLAPTPAGQLRRALAEGAKGLLVLTHVEVVTSLAKLLEVGRLPAEEATVKDYAMLGAIDFSHPLFVPFAEPRFADFTKIHFWQRRILREADLPNARVLARFEDGAPALVEFTIGRGGLYVLTAGWQPSQSELARSSKFVPLLHGILDLGTLESAAQVPVGAAVPLSKRRADPVTVVMPGGNAVVLPVDAERFTETTHPGVYTFRRGSTGEPDDVQVAVNLSAAESNTAPMTSDAFAQSGIRLQAATPLQSPQDRAARERQMLAAELESRQKLWQWLIAAAVVLLLGETWLAGLLARRR